MKSWIFGVSFVTLHLLIFIVFADKSFADDIEEDIEDSISMLEVVDREIGYAERTKKFLKKSRRNPDDLKNFVLLKDIKELVETIQEEEDNLEESYSEAKEQKVNVDELMKKAQTLVDKLYRRIHFVYNVFDLTFIKRKKKKNYSVKLNVFPESLSDVKKVRTLRGSTNPELVSYQKRFFVLKSSKNHGHIKTEYYANKIYALLNMPVPDMKLYDDPQTGGRISIMSRYVEDTQEIGQLLKLNTENNYYIFEKISEGYVADALLSNWDVFGLGGDNVLIDPRNLPWRIDTGGSLAYRAQGGLKDNWNENVIELVTNYKKYSHNFYSHVTKKSAFKQIDDIVRLEKDILNIIPEDFIAGGKKVREVLKSRIDFLKKAKARKDLLPAFRKAKPSMVSEFHKAFGDKYTKALGYKKLEFTEGVKFKASHFNSKVEISFRGFQFYKLAHAKSYIETTGSFGIISPILFKPSKIKTHNVVTRVGGAGGHIGADGEGGASNYISTSRDIKAAAMFAKKAGKYGVVTVVSNPIGSAVDADNTVGLKGEKELARIDFISTTDVLGHYIIAIKDKEHFVVSSFIRNSSNRGAEDKNHRKAIIEYLTPQKVENISPNLSELEMTDQKAMSIDISKIPFKKSDNTLSYRILTFSDVNLSNFEIDNFINATLTNGLFPTISDPNFIYEKVYEDAVGLNDNGKLSPVISMVAEFDDIPYEVDTDNPVTLIFTVSNSGTGLLAPDQDGDGDEYDENTVYRKGQIPASEIIGYYLAKRGETKPQFIKNIRYTGGIDADKVLDLTDD